jgi:prepilin-type N-terminal cleavage/methylation domain-containing protein
MPHRERGFTLIEVVVVMLMLAVVGAIALPRAVKASPELQVDLAARALTRDLEQLRMRAIAAKRHIRVRFDESEDFYTAFMDITPVRAGTFSETSDEVYESRLLVKGKRSGVPGVPLPTGVVFGLGSVSLGPQGTAVSDPIALDGDWIEFDAHGMTVPAGSSGVIFLTHSDDPTAIAAVTITGASAFRSWRYRGGRWIK